MRVRFVATTKDIQTAVDQLADKFNTSVLIEDLQQFPIWWSTRGEVDPIRQATVLYRNVEPEVADVVAKFKLQDTSVPIRIPELPELGMWSRIAIPIRDKQQVVGYLWVLDPDQKITIAEYDSILDLAQYASDELGKTVSEKINHVKQRNNLINRLLHGEDQAAATELAKLENIPIDARIQVTNQKIIGGWQLPNGFSVIVEGKFKREATSGKSLPLAEIAEANRRAELTQRAHLAGALLPQNTWDDLGVWRLIVEAPETITPEDILPGIEKLLDEDNAELLETARRVLDSTGDISAIAKKLFIHRTTLYYRMDRILELTGVDLRNSSSRLQLQQALWLSAFRKVSI